VHFLIGISKRPLCIIHQNGWCITRGTQMERKLLCLESRCYNKSHPGPKLMTSLRLMIKSLSLFLSNPCLTFLSITYISFTPNQVYSLVHFYHQALSLWLHECLHVSYLVPKYSSRSIQYYVSVVHFGATSVWSYLWLRVSILFDHSREYHLQ
jgi:hypothetical protein